MPGTVSLPTPRIVKTRRSAIAFVIPGARVKDLVASTKRSSVCFAMFGLVYRIILVLLRLVCGSRCSPGEATFIVSISVRERPL